MNDRPALRVVEGGDRGADRRALGAPIECAQCGSRETIETRLDRRLHKGGASDETT